MMNRPNRSSGASTSVSDLKHALRFSQRESMSGINEYRALLVRRFIKIAKRISMENDIFAEILQEVG